MTPAVTATTASRWLPVIARDDCVGCNRCVPVCPHQCLELVWDFATLVRAADCNGCSRCERACPHDVIRMAWFPPSGGGRVPGS